MIILLVCCITMPATTAGNGKQNKKCMGATPCLVCKTTDDCKNCKYCKTSKKCGNCKAETRMSDELKTRRSICDGSIIYGPSGEVFLPLPATIERAKNSLEKIGLAFRDNVAIDTSGGKVLERYRFVFTGERLTSIVYDTSFSNVESATHYADSISNGLKKLSQSTEDVVVAIGLGGHKTYYLPPIICGFRAIGHTFAISPDLIDRTATLTHEIKMVALPSDK